MKHRVGWMGLLSLVTSACVGHVRLPAAPRRAPLEYRVAVYNAYRPVQVEQVNAVMYGAGAAGLAPFSSNPNGLILANGTRVTEPEDLVRLAGRRSPTAVAARAHTSAIQTSDVLFWTAIGGATAGAAIATAAMFTRPSGTYGPNWPVLGVGLGVEVLSLVPLLVGMGVRSGATRQRQLAFEAYDESLLHNLGLDELRPNGARSPQQLSLPIDLSPAQQQPAQQPTQQETQTVPQPADSSPIETVRPVETVEPLSAPANGATQSTRPAQ